MRFSVIIPVYNEENGVRAAVEHVRGLLAGLDGEIIVADSSPGGATLDALGDAEAVKLRAPKGRAAQMNAGARLASGDTLVFLHADTRLPENPFRHIEAALFGGGYRAGAFKLKIDSPRLWLRFVAWTANIRNAFTGIPYGDQAIFVERRVFEAAGGYSEIPIMEDVDLLERIRDAGGRIAILDDFALTSPRRWESEGLFLVTFTHHLLRLLRLSGAGPEKSAAFRNAAGLPAKLKVLAGKGPI